MTYGKNTTRINSIYFFQCSRRSKGRCSTSSYINEKKAEQSVVTALNDLLSSDAIDYERRPFPDDAGETESLIKSELIKLEQKEKRIKDAYINEIDTLEEYRDNKAAINLQRENLLKQLENTAKEKTLTNEKQYETEIRHSLKSIIQMIETNPEKYVEIGNALREHVSQIVYNKEKDHMTFYLY